MKTGSFFRWFQVIVGVLQVNMNLSWNLLVNKDEQGWMEHTPQQPPQPPPLIHAACTPNQVFLQLPHSGPATGFSLGSVQNYTQSPAPPLLHVPIQQSSPPSIRLLHSRFSFCVAAYQLVMGVGTSSGVLVHHMIQ